MAGRQSRNGGPLSAWLSQMDTADGVFGVDAEQKIVYWSPSAQEILGFKPEEVLGRPCYEVIGGRDARNYKFCRKNCPVTVNSKRGRSTPSYDILVLDSDKDPTWINASIVLHGKGSSNGTGPVLLHFFRDVTGRRKTEERAQKTLASLRQFLANEDGAADEGPSAPPPPRLTPREQEVLRLLASGLTTEQVAESLGVSPLTARNHITNLLAKLGVANRLQAVLYASSYHLV